MNQLLLVSVAYIKKLKHDKSAENAEDDYGTTEVIVSNMSNSLHDLNSTNSPSTSVYNSDKELSMPTLLSLSTTADETPLESSISTTSNESILEKITEDVRNTKNSEEIEIEGRRIVDFNFFF